MGEAVRLAVIPGDGIGPEVVDEALKVLAAVSDATDLTFEQTRFSLGAQRYLDTGDVLTDDDLDATNTAEQPDRVTPSGGTGARLEGSALHAELPPRSWNVLRLQVPV